MAREAMIWNFPTVRAADTEAALADAPALECQVTSLMLTPAPVFNTIPSTGCAGASQSPGVTGFAADLAWLQDWSKPVDESLSWFAWNNDGRLVWLEVIPDRTAANQLALRGRFYCTSGGFGATFGDGSAAATTASWPALEKPTIEPYVPPAVDEATAGTPGTWSPSGATPPANAAAATAASVTASPATAWTAGQYVQGSTAGAGGEMHWTGTAWAAGRAT